MQIKFCLQAVESNLMWYFIIYNIFCSLLGKFWMLANLDFLFSNVLYWNIKILLRNEIHSSLKYTQVLSCIEKLQHLIHYVHFLHFLFFFFINRHYYWLVIDFLMLNALHFSYSFLIFIGVINFFFFSSVCRHHYF